MSTWLITGGCGFIGRNLIARLAATDARIRVLDNAAVCGPEDLGRVCAVERVTDGSTPPAQGVVQFMQGDVRDEKATQDACRHADIIVHLAANTGVPKSVADPVLDFQVNAWGTFRMLEAARRAGARRFIFASSGAPAGNATPPVTEMTVPRPISPYGASKLAGEGYCSAYAHCFGVETVALRFSNVYGPWSAHKTSVVARFLGDALRGREWEIYGDGSQTRDFLHVEDLVRAILCAAEAGGVGGEVFQISTGREHTLLELAACLTKALADRGVKVPPARHDAPRLGDMPRNYADPARAAAMLGWKSRIGLEEGVRATVDWFLASGGRD